MARRAKAAPPPNPALNNVSVVLLQRCVAKLERQLEEARDTRWESEAEEDLEKLRALLRRTLPLLRAGLGRESVDDSLAKYDAFRAYDDLAEEVL